MGGFKDDNILLIFLVLILLLCFCD